MAKFPVKLSAQQTQLGIMRACLYQNQSNVAGPPWSLGYEFEIPIHEFNTGLWYELQPVKTAFTLWNIPLPFHDWRMILNESLAFDRVKYEYHGNLFVGEAHNPLYVNSITIKRKDARVFAINCSVLCDFEFQSEWENEEIQFDGDVVFEGLMIDSRQVSLDLMNIDAIREILAKYVTVDGYVLNPSITGVYWIFPPNYTTIINLRGS